MGGSSLAPLVLGKTFGVPLEALDTTHPAAIRRLEVDEALFVVSSKSGTTVETRCHFDYLWERTGKRSEAFVVITDPGSPLEELAHERGVQTVAGEPTIGGRYSALSVFGLVPAALAGVDVGKLLERAEAMHDVCRVADGNPALELGLALGAGWDQGRDKIVFGNPAGFGLWLEQLLAESTGKDGQGLVPAVGELSEGDDRQHVDVGVADPYEIGADFFRFELATAVAGAVMGLNPFDQPNVEQAKERARAILSSGHGQGTVTGTVTETVPRTGPIETVDDLFEAALPGDYFAIQAFVDPAREHELEPLAERAREQGRYDRPRPALSPLDGTAPQGRSAHRPFPPGDGRGRCGRGHSETEVRLQEPHRGAGCGRLRRARGSRQAYRAGEPRGGRRVNLGMVGLGRMGGNMAERLRRAGHTVETYARTAPERTAGSLVELVGMLDHPRVVWLMIPAGDPTENAFQTLLPLLEDGDIVVDGGNSNFRDSERRAAQAAEKDIHFLDAGVSGGVWGLEEGYCIMVGGPAEGFALVEPFVRDLAQEGGYAHVGASGSGHFVKMVHNGIEYGMMQSLAEGFEIMRASELELDLRQLADLWQHGSVVRGWLLELLERAFAEDPDLAGIRGYVEDSGEGRWTVEAAIDERVPAPTIALALFSRFASRQEESFAAQVNAALRKQFGGHAVRTSGDDSA
jgi:6-phosphogluconate dehydrogenase